MASLPSVQALSEAELINAAKDGDSGSFARLLEPQLGPLRSFIHRMIGHPEDTEELLQDTVARALTAIQRFRKGSSFRTWLFAIASHVAIDHLRRCGRWRFDAQVHSERECLDTEEMVSAVVGTFSDPEFEFDVREHIAFCFACVSRSLAPEESAALVLREFLEFSNREGAAVLGLSESTFRHRLSAARAAMKQRYDDLCSLVSKRGVCYQCSRFQRGAVDVFEGVDRSGDALRVRLRVVRESMGSGGSSAKLHALQFAWIKRLEARGMK